MADVAQFGRESRAPFAFVGAVVELSRAVPLAAGEHVLLHGVGRSRTGRRLPRPVLLRLSPPRLVAMSHYALAPDRILELPRAAVSDIGVDGSVIHVVWRRAADTTSILRVGPWTGPSRFDRPLLRPAELGQLLDEWLRTGQVDVAATHDKCDLLR